MHTAELTQPAQEAQPVQRFKTTNQYLMSYMHFRGVKIANLNRNSMVGRAEVTFEGPNAQLIALEYKNSEEKSLLDAFIFIKALIHGEVNNY